MYRYTYAVDRELNICAWDKNLEKIQDKTLSDVRGLPYHQFLPRIFLGKKDALVEVIRSGKPLQLKGYPVACFFGSSVADITILPVTDDNGAVIGAKVKTDAFPGCVLSQKLQWSQPLIDIGKISTTLAHGVRNPLNAIKGAVVYLNDKYKSEPTIVEFTQIIEEEITKLDTFITKFLSTSFMDSEITDLDVNVSLKKIVAITQLQAQTKNITYLTDFCAVPTVKADAFQLEHAILNVVNNAMEAMQSGGSITFKTAAVCINGGDHVLIEISDSGPGMPNRTIDGMLYPLKERGKAGRGFGLFITREVVQYHGGYMEISSEKNAGTSVKIYLPVKKST
ncbi:MAG: two-component system NtrC family nitrogen regulation sensor histidine kinase [Geobacteraceae bacterium]|nr:MAG: two-component system NtrC family nitrogen regulation sensor histidine kinase [Geobacteraceae bacterium]